VPDGHPLTGRANLNLAKNPELCQCPPRYTDSGLPAISTLAQYRMITVTCRVAD